MYGSAYDPSGVAPPPVPMEQPKSLFRFGETSIWSTFNFQGGTAISNSQFRLFTTPRGQTGQGFTNSLTIAETNLKEGGRVPSGVAYDVFGVACHIMQGDATTDAGPNNYDIAIDSAALITNLINIQNNGVLSWDFTQTIVEICPVHLAGAGGGAFGSVAASTGTGTAGDLAAGQMNNGNGQIWMYRKYPVALPGNSTFSIQLSFGSRAGQIGTNCVGVKCILLGYYKNVIEIG